MKEEKEMYESPQCESLDIVTEGVICSSGDGDAIPYQYPFGGNFS